jgi:hypothetical protein
MRIEELNHTIKEIDQALLRLYKAKEKGYNFFDFYRSLEKVFHLLEIGDDQHKKIVRDYSSVFADLLRPVVHIVVTVKEINTDNRTITWLHKEHHSKHGGLITKEVVQQFDEQSFKDVKDYKIGHKLFNNNKADIEICNYYDYLDGVEYREKESRTHSVELSEYFFLNNTRDLFKRNGYEMPNQIWLSFEKYVGFIEEDDSFTYSKVNFSANQNIPWTGTPGEFGSIIGELISKGFIPQVKDLKNTVRILSSVFEVKNGNGEIVEVDYLYKCFGEKKKGYYAHELKIPISDNFKKS